MYRRDLTSHSGGLLVYVSNIYASKRRLDLESEAIQSILVEIKYRSTVILLCTIYRPPGTRVAFRENLSINIEKALECCPHILLLGDLNEDLLNPNEHHLSHIISLNDFTNVITKPTRISETSATLLDPILISNTVHALHSDTLDVDSFFPKPATILRSENSLPQPDFELKITR